MASASSSDRGEVLGVGDVVALDEEVAGVEAEAEPLAAAGQLDQLGGLVEVAAEQALVAGGLLEQQRAASRCPSSAAAITFAARFIEGPSGSPFCAPGWRTTPAAPIPSPIRSAWVSEASDFLRSSLSLRGAVDQVDGVDHHRFDRRGVHRLAEGGEVLVAVAGRPPHARALVEDLDRFAAALRRRARSRWRARRLWKHALRSACAQRSTPVFRFAPSPTGALHIGGARTALYNWLAARHEGGELVLRIEDTDRERSTAENVEQILDALRWLELDWDEGPISPGRARPSATRRRWRGCSSPAPPTATPATAKDVEAWKAEHGAGRGYRGDADRGAGRGGPPAGARRGRDRRRGPDPRPGRLPQRAATTTSSSPAATARVLYNFAVAVDDAEMGITDVVRGDDHLSNTPKQLLVLEALGHEPPRYAHLPLLHGPDGKKLSKRHGAASVQELREAGYLPAAVRNYLALLGWGTDDDTTLMSTEELVERFRVEDVGSAAAIFDEKKLRWINGRYMRELPLDEYTAAVAAPPRPRARRAPARGLRDRPGEGADPGRGLAADPLPLRAAGRRREGLAQGDEGRRAGALLEAAREALARASSGFDAERGRGGAGAAARSASASSRAGSTSRSGWRSPARTVSPGIFESLAALGREQSLARIDAAIARLRLTPDAAGRRFGSMAK